MTFTPNREALQELYRVLDTTPGGTSRIAWYGQLRAEGYDHDEALTRTAREYGIRLPGDPTPPARNFCPTCNHNGTWEVCPTDATHTTRKVS